MSAITNQTVLVDLNMSVWTGSKQDRVATDEVIIAKNAGNAKAAKVTKNLLADSEKLKMVQTVAAATRMWFYRRTLPWGNSGSRLLPTKEFLAFRHELSENEDRFNDAVQAFLAEYPSIVEHAAVALGDLFDLSEYPTPRKAAHKFAFKYAFSPVPESGDFRVEMEDAEVEFLKKEYEKEAQSRVEVAMAEAWDRVHKTCKHLSERLASDANGKRKIIRDSVLGNAKELLDTLRSLNITDDPKLNEAERDLQNALFAVDSDDVRKSEAVRDSVKARVDTLLDKMGAWGIGEQAQDTAQSQPQS